MVARIQRSPPIRLGGGVRVGEEAARSTRASRPWGGGVGFATRGGALAALEEERRRGAAGKTEQERGDHDPRRLGARLVQGRLRPIQELHGGRVPGLTDARLFQLSREQLED